MAVHFKESATEGWRPLRITRPWEIDHDAPSDGDDIDPAAFAAFRAGPAVR